VLAVDAMTVRVVLIGLGIIGTVFILTRPTTETVLAQTMAS
jgi:hypothetical protein